ncbi:hypothetical protein BHM03_00016261 [Ensete ventricosum]|nr:hypothetical protein BHM03_00016261 [Ensete ventricosum]
MGDALGQTHSRPMNNTPCPLTVGDRQRIKANAVADQLTVPQTIGDLLGTIVVTWLTYDQLVYAGINAPLPPPCLGGHF